MEIAQTGDLELSLTYRLSREDQQKVALVSGPVRPSLDRHLATEVRRRCDVPGFRGGFEMSALLEGSIGAAADAPPSALDPCDTRLGWTEAEAGPPVSHAGNRPVASADWVAIDPSLCVE